ncbi:hypothetical protein B0H14DRAFT_2599087 [Mycena olivaceomarginata]|nr:hypothetical protein B0H14DRAFT_2599087 [Mycena olivaceomarginata]
MCGAFGVTIVPLLQMYCVFLNFPERPVLSFSPSKILSAGRISACMQMLLSTVQTLVGHRGGVLHGRRKGGQAFHSNSRLTLETTRVHNFGLANWVGIPWNLHEHEFYITVPGPPTVPREIVSNINGVLEEIHLPHERNTRIQEHFLHKPLKPLQIPRVGERVKLAVVFHASVTWHSTEGCALCLQLELHTGALPLWGIAAHPEDNSVVVRPIAAACVVLPEPPFEFRGMPVFDLQGVELRLSERGAVEEHVDVGGCGAAKGEVQAARSFELVRTAWEGH